MADGGPPASPKPQPPIFMPFVPTVQLIVPPAQLIQPAHIPQLNWSYFKPEFADKL